ncbi:MAG TPA: PhnD/SsuA/transferrin family substrate-binding protein [Polyangiaceae bacterium]|jgi:ABC-type phosphate/phosphonate transport system substrate-binding protein
MATTPKAGASAALELGAFFDAAGLELEPVFVPSYAALIDAMKGGRADAAWCPPIVARDLRREGVAATCACIERNGTPVYYSAIVGAPSLSSPADVKRFGWVSQLSAAGYLVPRSYLAALPKPIVFEEERFFHTHERTMEALKANIVDAIATYAIKDNGVTRVPHAFEGAKVLTTIGPLPGDVIMIEGDMGVRQAKKIATLLENAEIEHGGAIHKLMGATRFAPVPHGHLESLSKWIDRLTSLRPTAS